MLSTGSGEISGAVTKHGLGEQTAKPETHPITSASGLRKPAYPGRLRIPHPAAQYAQP